MISIKVRLEFKDIFPEEKEENVLEYLKKVSKESLINIIGFTTTLPQPNYDNFFSNSSFQVEIINRVRKHCKEKNFQDKPVVISREGSLRLAELILANKEDILSEDRIVSKYDDEVNLFKSFLIINKEINKKSNSFNLEKDNTIIEDENISKIAMMLVSMAFPNSDLGFYEDSSQEIGKHLYAAIVRFEKLIDFILSKEEYNYLLEALLKNFKVENHLKLIRNVKYLLIEILILKVKESFKFNVKDNESKVFLESLLSLELKEESDFLKLRNSPIYKIDENTFSIIDSFFVIDKFTKGVKFILKDAYNKKHNLPKNSSAFFSFFNDEFSEKHLSKSILDEIFNKKYHYKKKIIKNAQSEPDYYIRYENKIIIFEIKDILIDKDVKISGNTPKILETLKNKLFKDKESSKPIGIGQLITHIKSITEKKFLFDDYIYNKKNITIYPILLLTDRIFETPGLNFILNDWYKKSIVENLGKNYNPKYIKELTIVDLDTLIWHVDFFKEKDKHFIETVESHLTKMNEKKLKPYGKTQQEFLYNLQKKIFKKLSPFSSRINITNFKIQTFIDKFSDLINK